MSECLSTVEHCNLTEWKLPHNIPALSHPRQVRTTASRAVAYSRASQPRRPCGSRIRGGRCRHYPATALLGAAICCVEHLQQRNVWRVLLHRVAPWIRLQRVVGQFLCSALLAKRNSAPLVWRCGRDVGRPINVALGGFFFFCIFFLFLFFRFSSFTFFSSFCLFFFFLTILKKIQI
jgi:hypothetical protein